jgi:cytochrome c-type biogenesis protein
MNEISALLVFGAGVASILSPCILPMLPAYVGYLAATGSQDVHANNTSSRLLIVVRALAFVAGFSTVFVLMGATASALGQLFLEYKPFIGRIGGIIIVVFGLQALGILRLPFLYRDTRLFLRTGKMDMGQAYLLGIAFAAGWTPCVGPILSTILLYAGRAGTLGFGVYLLSIYSLGLAIPFLAIALGTTSLITLFKTHGRLLEGITKLSGIIMVVFGLMLATDVSLFY